MRASKSLQMLAGSINCFIELVKFTGNGQTKIGFVIVDADNNELLELEPVNYSNGDKWKAINKTVETNRLTYYKSLKGIDKAITLKPGYTGYKWTSLTHGRNGQQSKTGIVSHA